MKKSKGKPYAVFAAYKNGIDVKLDTKTDTDEVLAVLKIFMCCAGYFCSIVQGDTETAIKKVCHMITDKKEIVERNKAEFEKKWLENKEEE